MIWFYKFIKRQSFNISNVIQIGTKLKEDSKGFTGYFFNILFKHRNSNMGENNCQIGNKDDIDIYFENIYKTSIEKIGVGSVNDKSLGKNKLIISSILCILGNGTKLPPLLIVRGKKNGPKENQLRKNKYVIKYWYFCQMPGKRLVWPWNIFILAE